jgi:pimeloyl-ACP methyl ester carboxylesterase
MIAGTSHDDLSAAASRDPHLLPDRAWGMRRPGPRFKDVAGGALRTPVVLERRELAEIHAPVLVISGDHDAIRLEHTIERRRPID